ncbi:MAG: hypothetical protein KDD41_02425 [Flavobacteriales bacterium]|nr:hypothetical protein [Flavobacteriales bacterium]
MKKYSLLFVLVLAFIGLNAQVQPHAIGARLGGGYYGTGFEVSYQHGFGDKNRLELDLGLASKYSSSSMSIAGIYQWVWGLGEGFNWFAGPGAQMFFYKNNSLIAIGGDIGVEYDFNVNLDTPLQISLDTRPMWGFAKYDDGFGWGAALGIRYTF